MGRRAEVIVMRDMQETPQPQRQHAINTGETTEVSALDLRASSRTDVGVLIRQSSEPGKDEVVKSIEAMRPQSSVLDAREFDDLVRHLSQSYSLKQMAAYLAAGSPAASNILPGTRSDLHRNISLWQAGITSPEKRIELVKPTYSEGSISTKSKAKIAERIIRAAWFITVHSEQQQMGEIEIRLKPWQMSLMFDTLNSSGKPLHRVWIESEFLFRAVGIELYRTDRVMRITARKPDATQVVAHLVQGLQTVHRESLDLAALAKRQGLGVWRKILYPEALAAIMAGTTSVIEYEGASDLVVYSPEARNVSNAKRLVLSLLDLPSPVSHHHLRMSVPSMKAEGSRMGALHWTKQHHSTPHQNYHGTSLCRIVTATSRKTDVGMKREASAAAQAAVNSQAKRAWQRRIKTLATRLQDIPETATTITANDSTTSLWSAPGAWEWTAHCCKLLAPGSEGTLTTHAQPRHPIFLAHDGSGLSQALEHFARRSVHAKDALASASQSSSSRQFIAHFMPSPLASVSARKVFEKLPRLALRFKYAPSASNLGEPLELLDLTAEVEARHAATTCPDLASDLFFRRSRFLRANSQQLQQNAEITDWISALRTQEAKKTGALTGPAELNVPLPDYLLEGLPQAYRKVVKQAGGLHEYVVERYEMVQELDCVPRARDHVRLESIGEDSQSEWPEDMFLRVRHVEGGLLGGTRTEVIVMTRQGEITKADEKSKSMLPLARTAMNMLKLLDIGRSGL